MGFHVGEMVGEYEITGILGAGSMGQVFQAEHRLTRRREALKVLSAECATEQQLHRFHREMELQAALNHPNIAAIHNAIDIDGQIVLVMELVEGQTLESVLKKGRIPLQQGVDYVRQTLSALQYAHARAVIHRDVTPANLIITPSGTIKLTDFGVAKSFGDVLLTNCGELVGSLRYMAPEQIKGESNADPRSDLYSVGAILYEVATGVQPFERESIMSLMLCQPEAELKRPSALEPSLPLEWEGVILRALARDRADRYQSADEFLSALDAVTGAPAAAVKAKTHALKYLSIGLATAGVAAVAVVAVVAARIRTANVPPPPALMVHIAAPPDALTPARVSHIVSPMKHGTTRHEAKVQPPAPLTDAPPSPEQSSVAAPEIDEPTAATPATAQHKRHIWSKLNPFHRDHGQAPPDSSQN